MLLMRLIRKNFYFEIIQKIFLKIFENLIMHITYNLSVILLNVFI